MNVFSVLTPYYGETVLFSKAAIQEANEDGITILFYLQKVFPGMEFVYISFCRYWKASVDQNIC
jgi:callose synthase